MKHRKLWQALIALVLFSVNAAIAVSAGQRDMEWPQFHGPRRDNLSRDSGLLKCWPEGGPKLIWKAAGIGHGFPSLAISGGRIYTAGTIEKDTVITALNMSGNVSITRF